MENTSEDMMDESSLSNPLTLTTTEANTHSNSQECNVVCVNSSVNVENDGTYPHAKPFVDNSLYTTYHECRDFQEHVNDSDDPNQLRIRIRSYDSNIYLDIRVFRNDYATKEGVFLKATEFWWLFACVYLFESNKELRKLSHTPISSEREITVERNFSKDEITISLYRPKTKEKNG